MHRVKEETMFRKKRHEKEVLPYKNEDDIRLIWWHAHKIASNHKYVGTHI